MLKGYGDYLFVRMGPPTFGVDPEQHLAVLLGSTAYRYDFFAALMKKLEDQFRENEGRCGFWSNRSTILYHAANLTIVVNTQTLEVEAFYIILPPDEGERREILIMEVFRQRSGLGRRIIDRERTTPGGSILFVGETLKGAVPFWNAVGVPYLMVE